MGIPITTRRTLFAPRQDAEGQPIFYRIPALLNTPGGTLLAFCERRRGEYEDHAPADTVMRRSEDGGLTWSAEQVVAEGGQDMIGNPTAVYDRQTGTVLLLLTGNPGGAMEDDLVNGTAPGTRTVWISRSEDGGVTWDAPTDITAQTKRPEWGWYATGPGVGIQMTGGRIMIPCDHSEPHNIPSLHWSWTKESHSHVIYSDDGGQSWQTGGTVPALGVNECQVVERKDGSLLLNLRNHAGQRCRAVSTSTDAGLTWSPVHYEEEMADPECQGSLIRHGDTLLFSNINHATDRRNLTLRVSFDDGLTWPVAHAIDPGDAMYSCLASLPEGGVGCLYEAADQRIDFVRLSLPSEMVGVGAS